MNKARAQEADNQKKNLLNKDYVKSNPVFTNDHILEFLNCFKLYADPRTNKVNIGDILSTARVLGIDEKYRMVFRVMSDLNDENDDSPIDFESFIRQLTDRIGNTFSATGREQVFNLMDQEGKGELDIHDLKQVSKQCKYNHTDEKLREIIERVGGTGSDRITYDNYETYLKRKVEANTAGRT